MDFLDINDFLKLISHNTPEVLIRVIPFFTDIASTYFLSLNNDNKEVNSIEYIKIRHTVP